MKKVNLLILSSILLFGCSGQNKNETSEDLQKDELEEVEEKDLLEDREYELTDLYDLHATIENPNEWVGREVKIKFTLAQDPYTGTVNEDTVHVLRTFVDTIYYNMSGGEYGLTTTTEFYKNHPTLKYKKGDVVHAIGKFDYSLFDEPRVEELELVDFQ